MRLSLSALNGDLLAVLHPDRAGRSAQSDYLRRCPPRYNTGPFRCKGDRTKIFIGHRGPLLEPGPPRPAQRGGRPAPGASRARSRCSAPCAPSVKMAPWGATDSARRRGGAAAALRALGGGGRWARTKCSVTGAQLGEGWLLAPRTLLQVLRPVTVVLGTSRSARAVGESHLTFYSSIFPWIAAGNKLK